jgi:NAD(P)-dependent dehydrogenase (short-subunit alcohol dehydrogenase family)
MRVERLFDVAGDVVVVTGAASGIGLAIAEVLGAHGAKLALLDIDGTTLEKLTRRLESSGVQVFSRRIDVGDPTQVRQALDEVTGHYGCLDTVFGNAGIGAGPGFRGLDGKPNPAGSIEEVTDDLWNKVIAVNLSAVFTTIRSAAVHMKPRRKGRIIVTTSIASFRNESWVGTPYVSAKAGAAHLMRQAALELAPFNITVNAIAPGAFATNIGGGRLKTESAQIELSRKIALGRVARPREIQGLALFLASPASGFITGVEIPIDGGSSLGS